ncbi:MAG: hypothetical protein NVS2B12_33560 [Ktedonobacteraceae bacterium]
MNNSTLLLLAPAINVLVTGLFASVVLGQYLRRRRSYQLYWSIALGMAFLATLAYIGMLVVYPTSALGVMLFRGYYALGGAVMPAWLGLGSIALISNKKIADTCCQVLCALSVLAATLIFLAPIDIAKLHGVAGTPGTGVLRAGAWLIMVIALNTLGVVAVAGVALYSGWKLLLRQKSLAGSRTSTIVWANSFIFAGAILNGAAGGLARFVGLQSIFWLIMALGWIVLFAGVKLASRRTQSTGQGTTIADEATQAAGT